MGRKSLKKKRKKRNDKVILWLGQLLLKLQGEDLEALTMDDMARLAGKSKSTVYEYFSSKEEILHAACEIRINAITASIAAKLQEELDTVTLYKDLVQIFAQGTDGITISFLQSIRQNYPQAWKIIDNFTDAFVELLKVHYRKGMDEGIYNNFSVDLMGHIDKLFVIEVVTNKDIFSDDQYIVSNLVRDYLNIRLNGLLVN